MKTGLSLIELAQKIEDQKKQKVDYVAPTDKLEMEPVISENKTALALYIGGDRCVTPNDVMHKQICEHLDIGAKYYNRMRSEAPELLSRNVNHWFRTNRETRLVRTMGPKGRAFLSDRYRPLENEDLANAVLPVLLERGVEILSCQITDQRMYIKGVDKRIQRDVPAGHRMGDGSHVFFRTNSPGIVISNSEVGMGAVSIEAGVFDHVCTNLATMSKGGMKKYHTGARHEISDEVYAMLSDKTRAVTDEALWRQVADVVGGAFDEAVFDARINEIKGMVDQKIDGDPIKVVEVSARKFGLNEGEKKSFLRNLIDGGDLSRFGLYNALTRTAEDVDDYDRATEFERFGGKVIDLSAGEWRELATAA